MALSTCFTICGHFHICWLWIIMIIGLFTSTTIGYPIREKCLVAGRLVDFEYEEQICCGNQVHRRFIDSIEYGCCNRTGIDSELPPKPYSLATELCCGVQLISSVDAYGHSRYCGDDLKVYLNAEDADHELPPEHKECHYDSNQVVVGDGSCCEGYDIPNLICCERKAYHANGSDACCGPNPYRSATHYCDRDVEILEHGMAICESSSERLKYNYTSSQCCTGGKIIDNPLGVKNPMCCGGIVGDGSTHICCADTKLMPIDEAYECCDTDYYQKDTHLCCEGNIYRKKSANDICCGQQLVDNVHEKCCRGQAYQTSEQRCCNNAVLVNTGLGEDCCDGQRLDKNHVCCSNGFQNSPEYIIKKTLPDHTSCCIHDHGRKESYSKFTSTCDKDTGVVPIPRHRTPRVLKKKLCPYSILDDQVSKSCDLKYNYKFQVVNVTLDANDTTLTLKQLSRKQKDHPVVHRFCRYICNIFKKGTRYIIYTNRKNILSGMRLKKLRKTDAIFPLTKQNRQKRKKLCKAARKIKQLL